MIRRLLAPVLLLAIIAGCGGTAGGPFQISDPGTDTTSQQLRFLHVATNTSNLQLQINGQSLLGQIGFGSVTPYVSINGTSVELTLLSDTSATTLFDSIITSGLVSLVTVVADGDSSGIVVRIIPDGRSAGNGQVKIRALHESPSSGAFDVYVTDALADITNLTPDIAGLGFRGISDYVLVSTGTSQVRFTTAGTKTVVLDTGSLPLGIGDVRTIVAIDSPSGGLPAQSKVIRDAGT
jgi:hypothetical protein